MTAPFARVDEHALRSARVHVPARGPWWADVVFDEAPDVAGRVSLWLGALELVGTIQEAHDGVTGLERRSRIVAGAGGWGTLLAAKGYHNDAQIRALTVAQDAAREAGETLTDFAPATERIGVDYVRQAGPASRVLEDVIGGAAWWVGYDGQTRVGERSSGEATGYELLEVDPAAHVATLAADELDGLRIGTTIDGDQLDEPQTIRELAIEVTEEGVRARAWFGADDGGHGRIARALRSVVARFGDSRLFGLWAYRVIRTNVDRVELQPVDRGLGLPELIPVSMWPGVAGAHAELAAGAEVLVQFVNGQRTRPVVTHFAGKDGTGWTPAESILSASSKLRLGSESATEAGVLGNAQNSALDTFLDAVKTWAALVKTGVQGGGGALDNTAFDTAIATAKTDLDGALSAKVTLE